MKECNGIRLFYRSFDEQSNSTQTKNDKVRNWFRKGQNSNKFKSVMFVDATPGDKLLKMLKNTESKFMISDNFRIRFVSKAGVKLKSLLQKKSISQITCSDVNGKPCVTSKGESIKTVKCKQNRVTYLPGVKVVLFTANREYTMEKLPKIFM